MTFWKYPNKYLWLTPQDDNTALNTLVNSLAYVKEPGDNRHLHFNIAELLASDMEYYLRYSGSLTTPGCHESVVWTLFADALTISQTQVSFSIWWVHTHHPRLLQI